MSQRYTATKWTPSQEKATFKAVENSVTCFTHSCPTPF